MPIKVTMHDMLTGEDTPWLLDPRNVLHRIVQSEDSARSPMLSRIDWYDTTEFHGDEVAQLIEELDAVIVVGVHDAADSEYLKELRDLASSCLRRPRCRLRFDGD